MSERFSFNQHFPIDSTLSSEIIDYLIKEEREHWLSVEFKDGWYSYKDLDYMSFMKVVENPQKIELKELKQFSPTKILVSNLSFLESFTRRFERRATIIHTDSYRLTQIMSLNSSKEYAVQTIAKKLGISLKKTVVFGDDFNDLGLFKLCGYPVSMGNAIIELKDLAIEITETNDQDGVPKALEILLESDVLD